jgi:HrpA-like RNA helicase
MAEGGDNLTCIQLAVTEVAAYLCMPLQPPPAQVHNFPFPTPPEAAALKAATSVLEALCALDPGSGALTPVGRAMAVFPIGPRHSRMLLEVGGLQEVLHILQP